MTRLLTLGETLGVAWTEVGDPLRTAHTLRLSTAGAESTVAVGMRRLGHQATWVGVVGADPIGQRVHRELAAEGVDVRFIRTSHTAPTAFMLRDRSPADRVAVTYYRAASAGSELSPSDVDAAFDMAGPVDVLHTTGITVALSDSCHQAVLRAIERARSAGVPVSFDVNLRTTLPGSRHVAARARALLADVDVLFTGADELLTVTDVDDPSDLRAAAAQLLDAGPREVVIKRGAAGATAYLADGGVWDEPATPVTVADVIGAGDSFVAGYLSARCEGGAIQQRLARGTQCAARTVGTHGDWEGLPTLAELHQPAGRLDTIR
jgi:2-dehydro-3-deoxygluconokinase